MEETLDRKKCMSIIRNLAESKGFYGRLLRGVETLMEEYPETYEQLMQTWEKKKFKSPVDLILYLEG
jgi:hypothetical protein